MEEAKQLAQKITEELLSFFGLNLDVAVSDDGEVIQVNVPSSESNGFLIGSGAETLHAMQNVLSSSLRTAGLEYTRVNLDIADYKKQRAERLLEEAQAWVDEVKGSGDPKELRPMNSAERRLIHQLAADNGLATESVGDGRDRRIVLSKED